MKLEDLKYNYNEKIVTRNMGDTTMAYNQSNGDMYELNEIGAEILTYLSKNMSMQEILDKLCNDYNASKDDIYEDVSQIVSRMIELNIISTEA